MTGLPRFDGAHTLERPRASTGHTDALRLATRFDWPHRPKGIAERAEGAEKGGAFLVELLLRFTGPGFFGNGRLGWPLIGARIAGYRDGSFVRIRADYSD